MPMSATVAEIKEWLSEFNDDEEVGIDEGGLALCRVGDPFSYYEIGGMPEEDE
jgi:hypothetical protein